MLYRETSKYFDIELCFGVYKWYNNAYSLTLMRYEMPNFLVLLFAFDYNVMKLGVYKWYNNAL